MLIFGHAEGHASESWVVRSMAVERNGRSPGDTKRDRQLVLLRRQFRSWAVVSCELVRPLEEIFVTSCNHYNW